MSGRGARELTDDDAKLFIGNLSYHVWLAACFVNFASVNESFCNPSLLGLAAESICCVQSIFCDFDH